MIYSSFAAANKSLQLLKKWNLEGIVTFSLTLEVVDFLASSLKEVSLPFKIWDGIDWLQRGSTIVIEVIKWEMRVQNRVRLGLTLIPIDLLVLLILIKKGIQL